MLVACRVFLEEKNILFFPLGVEMVDKDLRSCTSGTSGLWLLGVP